MIAILASGLIVLVGGIFTAVMIWQCVKARNRLKLIDAAPLYKAEELASGPAKMRGRIVPLDEEELLTSPMTRTTCLYYRFLVEEEQSRRVTEYQNGRRVTRTETFWETIVDDMKTVETEVRDETGGALVDLREAELTLRAMEGHSGTFNDVSPSLERTLQKRYGVSGKGLIFNKKMRYTEAVLEEGAKVFVVGDCKVRKSGEARFYRGDNPLLVTDKNEEQFVGHLKRRFIGFAIGSVALPVLVLGIAGAVGFAIHKHQASVTPPMVGPQGAGGPQAGAPVAADPLSRKLQEVQDRRDKWARVRAAHDLARMPVEAGRRDEVAQVINGLLDDPDKETCEGGISAAKTWGTQRANEASLKRLAAGPDPLQKMEAAEALTKLAP